MAYLFRLSGVLLLLLGASGVWAVPQQWYVDVVPGVFRDTSLSSCNDLVAYANGLNNAFTYVFFNQGGTGFPDGCVIKTYVRATGAYQGADDDGNQLHHRDSTNLCAGKAGSLLNNVGSSFGGNPFEVTIPALGAAPTAFCSDGCVVNAQQDMRATDAAGVSHAWYSSPTFSGASCTDADIAVVADPKADPEGTCSGTLNGTVIKYKCATTTTVTPTSTSSTTTTGTATSNTTSTGSTTTTCSNSVCTTVTNSSSTVNTGGTTATPTSSMISGTTTQAAFCAANATSAQCGGGAGKDNGSGAPFTCDGDAVMCATAKAVNETRCLLDAKGATESAVYAAAAAAAAGASSPLPSTTTDVAGQIDTSSAFGGAGSCWPDTTTTVMGKTFTLSFSQVCPALETAGNILLGISFLIALGIIAKGVNS
jgi:hypothetical protein